MQKKDVKSKLRKLVDKRSASTNRRHLSNIMQARLYEALNIVPSKLIIAYSTPTSYTVSIAGKIQQPIIVSISCTAIGIKVTPCSLTFLPTDTVLSKTVKVDTSGCKEIEDESGNTTIVHKVSHTTYFEGKARFYSKNDAPVLCRKELPVYFLKTSGGAGPLKQVWTQVPSSQETQIVPVETGSKNSWKCITLGGSHALLHASDNTMWSVGYGGSGQLGIDQVAIENFQCEGDFQELKGNLESAPMLNVPLEVKGLGAKVAKVACGKYHTLYLTETRQVFSNGLFTNGRLGLGRVLNKNIITPTCIDFLSNKIITNIACGKDFSLALTASGKLFAWGSNKYGSLGSLRGEEWDPVSLDDMPEISSIVAGPAHCGGITKSGKVYMWGLGEHGQLGIKLTSGEKYTPIPQPVSLPSKTIIALALGKYHTLALTHLFEVYVWGTNSNGQLGISGPPPTLLQRSAQIFPPTLVRALVGKGICRISCGKIHSCGLSLSGLVYTWGDNKKEQLGHPAEVKTQGIPMIVKSLIGKPLTNVYAGYNYTVVLENSKATKCENQEYFESWKNTIIMEEQKEIHRLIKDETERIPTKRANKPAMNSLAKTTINCLAKTDMIQDQSALNSKRSTTFRFRRRKVLGDGPMLVTSTTKVYKFNRSRCENTYVTVFTGGKSDSACSSSTIYDKFWFQNSCSIKQKDNASIFFADKSNNDDLIE